MVKYLLEAEPKSQIHLLYGNRKPENSIFLNNLQQLEEDYKGQFFLKNVYSKGKKPKWNIFRIDDSDPWRGRVDEKKVKKWLKKNPSQGLEAHYYICGPGSMNEDIYQYLQDNEVPVDHIHVESFRTQEELKAEGTLESTWELEAKINGESHKLEVMGNRPILEVLLDDGVDAPHSCTSGACASCMAKIEEGEVEMDVDFALTEEEKEQGYVLTCQSRPKTGYIKVNYDV
jgi:ring-1,2-phenylacetyl-CoA epoxidase subunit PaaE